MLDKIMTGPSVAAVRRDVHVQIATIAGEEAVATATHTIRLRGEAARLRQNQYFAEEIAAGIGETQRTVNQMSQAAHVEAIVQNNATFDARKQAIAALKSEYERGEMDADDYEFRRKHLDGITAKVLSFNDRTFDVCLEAAAGTLRAIAPPKFGKT